MNLEKAENILKENGLSIIKEGVSDSPYAKVQYALETYAEHVVQTRYGAGQGRRMFDWNTREAVIAEIRGILADFEKKVLEIV